MRFVDLARDGYVIEPRYWFWGWSSSPRVLARGSLAAALRRSKKELPKGWNFKVWDCQRPRRVQLLMLDSFRRRLRAAHPGWSKAKLEKVLFTFGARPTLRVTRLDAHRNGGAIDLTLVDAKGRELWMGTDHDDLTERAALDYFETNAPRNAMDREARKNRRLLKRVMLSAGFLIYPPEWWHWSYAK
ncbi:MAG TPA: M15 family metallopeptidase [Patescibacteria group bacterium]|nr:M15 family metallopeptidase [Patescibacteria group bacterium]